MVGIASRRISQPACFKATACAILAAGSDGGAHSIDWTAIGWPEPMETLPTVTVLVVLRCMMCPSPFSETA